jgi:hypothetical protein
MLKKETPWIEECERFLESLEMVRLAGNRPSEKEELLRAMPAEVRGHVPGCSHCEMALEDFAETRSMLLSGASTAAMVEPGPWFSTKVMNAIAAKENEIEEREGVWQGVGKLAPRLAAICALVLVLGGTWAVKTSRKLDVDTTVQVGESLFEPTPSVALDDDVLINRGTHR